MSGTRQIFFVRIPAGGYQLVQEDAQVVVVDEVVLEEDAELDIQGELVVLP